MKNKGVKMRNLIVIVMFALFTFVGCGKFQKEILISKDQIQSALDKKFPYDKNAIIARLTLDSTKVYFKGKNIGFKLSFYGNFLSKEIKGIVDFNGNIFYRHEKGAFYLKDFEIAQIAVNEANFSQKGKLEATVLKIVKNYLDDYPVYRLNQDDFKQNIAKLILKDISVQGENLSILLVI